MNRLITVIVIVVFVWANAALGMPGGCCCPMDTPDPIKCPDDAYRTGHDDSSCNHKNAANHTCHDGCVSLRCPQDYSPVKLSESETVLPHNQVLAFPMATSSTGESLKTAWPNARPFLCRPEKPVSLLLQTCSYLS